MSLKEAPTSRSHKLWAPGSEIFRAPLPVDARPAQRLDALVAELEAEGLDATGFPADLADRDAVPALIDQLPTPRDPLVLADTHGSLYSQRNRFEEIIGPTDR